jgi:DNA-binding Xre family transcriptional regulator
VKIGSAKNVELRRKQLQTGQPFPLQIRASVAVAHDIGRIEKRIQAMLREVCAHGEWFDLPMDTATLAALVTRAMQDLADQVQESPIPAHMRTLAERVHLLRRRQRYSQADLAKRATMSPTTLSNIEQAKAPTITVEHLVALARFLGTTPDYLLGMEPRARQGRRTADAKGEQSELFPTLPVLVDA